MEAANTTGSLRVAQSTPLSPLWVRWLVCTSRSPPRSCRRSAFPDPARPASAANLLSTRPSMFTFQIYDQNQQTLKWCRSHEEDLDGSEPKLRMRRLSNCCVLSSGFSWAEVTRMRRTQFWQQKFTQSASLQRLCRARLVENVLLQNLQLVQNVDAITSESLPFLHREVGVSQQTERFFEPIETNQKPCPCMVSKQAHKMLWKQKRRNNIATDTCVNSLFAKYYALSSRNSHNSSPEDNFGHEEVDVRQHLVILTQQISEPIDQKHLQECEPFGGLNLFSRLCDSDADDSLNSVWRRPCSFDATEKVPLHFIRTPKHLTHRSFQSSEEEEEPTQCSPSSSCRTPATSQPPWNCASTPRVWNRLPGSTPNSWRSVQLLPPSRNAAS